MHSSLKFQFPFLLALGGAIAGCASTQPVAYGGLASAAQLRPNADDKSGRIPYSYSTAVTLRDYSSIIIDPVLVYRGQDSQFEEVSDEQKDMLAAYMQGEFESKLRHRLRISRDAGWKTLRLRLTLTGAKSSTRFLSTVTRFDLVGGPYNIVQSIRGKEGTFTGSVSYAVELYDANTNLLVSAYVAKQYPSPMNISASLGPMDASKAGIQKGADELLAAFN
ncbi:hypothetical protein Jab_1c11540 [Janthinobacterium sp. HH01]|uniref:DUF3313 domain-containing protein n=1 Tax=Janthinobacterium sp. HH01 TaxID=1198452 RepID=UPI0002AEDCF5|nr:DUF3313 domain-containing protein [Janthinobacterium sp. HH01]ELX12540.1 hypothetical protein Jab_1c11540 [Janthinobacterium sp. HH01]